VINSLSKSSPSKKKSGEDLTPSLIEVSKDDRIVFEAYNTKAIVRDLMKATSTEFSS
jgi:hypothetical protein